MSEGRKLLKMADLVRLSGVPASTIKHYMREGLLPEPAARTGRNMAYYGPETVPRILRIKRLQRTRFLPLKVIKGLLEDRAPEAATLESVADRIGLELADLGGPATITRAEALEGGMTDDEFRWLESRGLLGAPEGPGRTYAGEDATLCRTLCEARQAGLTREMLPVEILEAYIGALTEMTQAEVQLFKMGVMPRAGDDAPALARAATRLSEQLLVTLRRKVLLPVFNDALAPQEPRSEASSKTVLPSKDEA